jgi:undecaprenyl diphosphate synthase
MSTIESTTADYVRSCGLDPERIPAHVAIIMDGNGRWAQERGLPRIEGHRQGVASVRRITEEACRLGISQLTLYCLSIENWKRPKQELDLLMQLLETFLVEERSTLVKNHVRLQVIGRRTELPSAVLEQMDETISLTSKHTGTTLCLAINYGGRAEIVDAARRLAEQVQAGELRVDQIDERAMEKSLYTEGMVDPDLLIRTAGERRVSNFLLWQISYAEIWITKDYWPDFEIEHLHQSIHDFSRRERRFGGLVSSPS